MNRKDIFISNFKSKLGYSFTYKDLAEFEDIIDFYEQQCKKLKGAIDKVIKYIEKEYYSKNTVDIDSIGITTDKLLQVRKFLKDYKN